MYMSMYMSSGWRCALQSWQSSAWPCSSRQTSSLAKYTETWNYFLKFIHTASTGTWLKWQQPNRKWKAQHDFADKQRWRAVFHDAWSRSLEELMTTHKVQTFSKPVSSLLDCGQERRIMTPLTNTCVSMRLILLSQHWLHCKSIEKSAWWVVSEHRRRKDECSENYM